MHNGIYQIHISKYDRDGYEFADFRLGILKDDYLIVFKYANQDCLLMISIPHEFLTRSRYKLINRSAINNKPSAKDKIAERKNDMDDLEYSIDSNSKNISVQYTQLAPSPAPKPTNGKHSGNKKYYGKPSIGKGALLAAKYKCEFDNTHISFISKTTGENYMEPHHLVPISRQGLYEYDIDITPNIICLCPVCHKKIHYGTKSDQRVLLEYFHKLRAQDLKKCGIDVDIYTLLAYYNA